MPIQVQTLGSFQLWRDGVSISSKEWGRDAAMQLFQFFITNRRLHALHKEQIIDRIWMESDLKAGEQNFKVALHGVNKVLEPNRRSRTDAKYIDRQGVAYQLRLEDIWVDVEALDELIAVGNKNIADRPELAKQAYYASIDLYQGSYLPNRLYEDWSTEERERVQLLALNALVSLSELLVNENPEESIRLAQEILQLDATWEEAYRIQMEAYLAKGNRPMVIKTYEKCKSVLAEEFGIDPLPETKKLLREVQAIN